MKPLNVLWITTHDINPHLGCYAGVWPGAEDAITPALDELAADGARFDSAFAVAPVCAPSRSSVITGCYPTAIGTMHMRTKAVPPPEVQLLPHYFREAGYYTTNSFFTDFQMAVPPTTFDDVSPTAHWRNRPDAGTPFFAQFHGGITHESQIYLNDDDFYEATAHVADSDRHDPSKVTLPPYYPETEVFRTSWARYLDLITEMDWSVGEILRQLDEDGLRESTIVVFWSDHGVGMPRAKRWANEAGLREPLIVRWPGRIPPHTVRHDPVSLMDLAPTMLEVCGIDVPPHMHGSSLLRRDGSAVVRPSSYVFGGRDRMDEQEDTTRTVRDERFRYTRHYYPERSAMQYCYYPDHYATWSEFRRLHNEESDELAEGISPTRLTPLQRDVVQAGKPHHELFDIGVDPHEQVNLAEDPRYADEVARLSAALDEWQASVGDLGLLAESDLMARWRPLGQARSTRRPRVSVEGGRVVVDCDTEGSVIGWTTDSPRELTVPSGFKAPRRFPNYSDFLKLMGLESDSRRWKLYSGPFDVSSDTVITVKAWRIGFEPSEEVTLRVATH